MQICCAIKDVIFCDVILYLRATVAINLKVIKCVIIYIQGNSVETGKTAVKSIFVPKKQMSTKA